MSRHRSPIVSRRSMRALRPSLVAGALILLATTACTSAATPDVTTSSSSDTGSTGATAPSPPSGGNPPTNDQASTGTDFDTAGLGGAIVDAMEADGTPGAVVLVRSTSHGDWTAAFGTRVAGTDVPVTADDVFGVGEISHVVAAAAVLVLAQQGTLSLTDPIDRYVPGVPDGDTITVGDLGRYDSGLFDYQDDLGFQQAVAADPSRSWSPRELLDVSFAHPRDPVDVTGARVAFSNTDYVLLGLVVENVTGKSAADAYRALVFDPLGLDSLGLTDGGALPDPHADGHRYAAGALGDQILTEEQRVAITTRQLTPHDVSAENTSWAYTAGGIHGTAADTADLFQAMVTAGPLLDESSIRTRLEDLESVGTPDARGILYGFGMARYGQYFLYSGSGAGFNTVAAFDPTTGTTIVVMTNLQAEGDGDAPVQALFTAVADVVGPVVVPAS